MPILPTNPVTSAGAAQAGLPGAEASRARAAERKREAERPRIKRGEDEVIVSATNVELDDPVRSLKGNSDEETREDRQEHPAYSEGKDAPPRPRIDLKG
jgi:hypothetical protein